MVIKRKLIPWIIAGIALAAILLIVLDIVLVAQAAPDTSPHRQGTTSPGVVSYQGQVNIGGIPFSGTGYFRFAIVDTGGTFYWSNDSSTVTPTQAITLTVVSGLFNVLLGETNPITYGMFSDSDRWLRVWFDDGTHGVQLLEPDTRITSALFAFRADESMTAITSTWSTTATVATTATNATTATYATTAGSATTALIATNAIFANVSNSAGTCDIAGEAAKLYILEPLTYFFPWNFARVGGNSWGARNPDTIASGQIPYWTTDYPFTQTNVLTSSNALTFNGSTLSTPNLSVSGSFSATVLTATNAMTATYATTALTATNATTATTAITSSQASGIEFPATQVPSAGANTLDDYEEGTWVPVLKFGGNSTGITYGTQSGFYTKVGNLVQVEMNIVLTSKGSSTGSATITGIPFTHKYYSTAIVYAYSLASLTSPVYVMSSGTTIYIEGQGAANAFDLTNANFLNASQLIFSLTYLTN